MFSRARFFTLSHAIFQWATLHIMVVAAVTCSDWWWRRHEGAVHELTLVLSAVCSAKHAVVRGHFIVAHCKFDISTIFFLSA